MLLLFLCYFGKLIGFMPDSLRLQILYMSFLTVIFGSFITFLVLIEAVRFLYKCVESKQNENIFSLHFFFVVELISFINHGEQLQGYRLNFFYITKLQQISLTVNTMLQVLCQILLYTVLYSNMAFSISFNGYIHIFFLLIKHCEYIVIKVSLSQIIYKQNSFYEN